MPFRMSTDNRLGVPDLQLYAVDTTSRVAVGTIIRAVDDAGVQGDAEFVYLQASVAVLARQAVVFRTGPNAAVALATSATHANKGRPVGIALTDIPLGSFGWFQITGTAQVVASAAALDATVSLSATAGTLTSAATAGTQLVGAVFAGALNSPVAGVAYVTLNRPAVQTQIT